MQLKGRVAAVSHSSYCQWPEGCNPEPLAKPSLCYGAFYMLTGKVQLSCCHQRACMSELQQPFRHILK